MQYMLMCCFNEERWNAIPEAERATMMGEYGEWVRRLDRSGHHVATAKLQPTSSATTVRRQNGRPVITDGPFAETKEQFGGYHLVECQDLDEAIAIASRIPTLPHGGTVEVRPVLENAPS